MSWDIFLFDFKGEPPDFDDLPDDFEPPSMGDAQAVRDRISSVLPGVDWSDPAWGILEGEGWSIEFSHRAAGHTVCIALHVRGGGDPITPIVELCRKHNWSAFDTGSGGFLDLEKPSDEGWKGFQGYRDHVMEQQAQEGQREAPKEETGSSES